MHEEPLNLVTIDSVGVVLFQNGFNFGYQSIYNMKVNDPSSCSVVIMVSTLNELKKIENHIQNIDKSLSNLCVIKGPNDE